MHMGKKLDALLGRSFKTCKFKTVTKLAISRVAIVKKHHQARYCQARSDVIELLNLGHHEQALSRVEYVIKELNKLDALVMIEDYCRLLIERVLLIQKNRGCPDELKEAITSIIFASSRCGEFPELQKLREIFRSRFGSEFAARAVELHNNCGVSPKMVQKLSSRRCGLESRLKVLQEISSEMGITLHFEEDVQQKQPDTEPLKLKYDTHHLPEESNPDERLVESVYTRKYYRDAASAAKDAFESASYAAEAARTAFELSRSESQDDGSDDPGCSSLHPVIALNSNMLVTTDYKSDKYAVLEEEADEDSNSRMGSEKSYTLDSLGVESEVEDVTEKTRKIQFKEVKVSERKAVRGERLYASGSDLAQDIPSRDEHISGFQYQNEQFAVAAASDFVDNDHQNNNQGSSPWEKYHDLDFHKTPRLCSNGQQHKIEYKGFDEQGLSDERVEEEDKHQLPAADSSKWVDESRRTKLTSSQGYARLLHTQQHSSIDWKKFSVRTKRLQIPGKEIHV